ncbi:MAG TPA: hypothetical protein V6D05_18930 [Stenomitos sp.]
MPAPYYRSNQDKVDDFLKHFYRNIIRPEVIGDRRVVYGVTAGLGALLGIIGIGAILIDPRLWGADLLIVLVLLEAQSKTNVASGSDDYVQNASSRDEGFGKTGSALPIADPRHEQSDDPGLRTDRSYATIGGIRLPFRIWGVMMVSPLIFPNLILVAQNVMNGEVAEGSYVVTALSALFFWIGWFQAPTRFRGYKVSTNPGPWDWTLACVVALSCLALCTTFAWPRETDWIWRLILDSK